MIHDMKINYPAGKESMIMVCDDIIDPLMCQDLISSLQPLWSSISYPGRTMGGLDLVTKSSEDAAFSELGFLEKNLQYTEFFYKMEKTFLEAFQTALMFYRNEFRALHGWMNLEDTGFQVQKYLKNFGHYREHVDSFPGTEVSSRVASGIIYLNTVESGGETNFPLHNVAVKAVQGRIVIFPALWTHPHEGRTPLSSEKWIINTFFLNKEEQKDIANTHIHDDNVPHEHHEHSENHDHHHADVNDIVNNDF